MDDGILRSKPPKPELAISREMIIGVFFLLALIISLAIVFGKRPNTNPKNEDKGAATPSQALTLLPSSYADIPPAPIKHDPISSNSNDDELLRELLKEELKKRERATSARLAAVSFQGLSSVNNSRARLANENEEVEEKSGLNSRDNVNRQDEKINFLNSKANSEVVLNQKIKKPVSPYQLMAGTIIPGVLISGINSDLPGKITGQVSQDVYDSVKGAHKLIPVGTKVLGTYDSKIVYGQERVLIIWTRLVFPNGNSISLEGMPGVDLSGYAGLSDQVDNHYGKLITGVLLSSVLGATAQVADGRTFNSADPSYSELALQGVARNTNQVGQQLTRKNLNIQPTLIIRPGFRFNVFVHKDMVLEPG